METNSGPGLSVGNYNIEMSSGGFAIFVTDEEGGERNWICTAADPEIAMSIVEGLVLVETKRFYYPESNPVFKDADGGKLPSFLKSSS